MINTVRRSSNLFLICVILFCVMGILRPQDVQAQGSTTPPQINGIFNPDTIYPSQTTRLTINVFNPNVSQLTEVNWIDHLPDDLIVVDPPNPMVTGCGGSYTLDASAGNDYIQLTHATTDGTTDPVNPGICSVTVSVTSFTPGNHTNEIHRLTDGDVTLNGSVTLYEYDASITLLVLPMSSPVVGKSFSPDTINEGETSQLTITIRNTDSNVALTQVSLTDDLPEISPTNYMTLSDTSTSLTNCGSGTLNPIAVGDRSIHLTNATIAPGATCTIRVNVQTQSTGTFTNIIHPADLTTYQQVTIPSNVSDDLVVENIQIDKQFSPDNFQVGTGYSTLSISITNPDTVNPLTNVHFTDTMDPDVTVVAGFSSVSGGGCSGDIVDTNPASLTLNNGVIPAGGTCVFSARVTSNVVGSHPNTVSCSEITFDGGTAGCAPASDTLTVYDTGLGLGVVKSFSSSNVAPNEFNRMTITITAPGDTDLTNFELTDNLPTGVVIYSTPNVTQTGCGGGTVTAAVGSSSISITGGTILAGAQCRIRVNVVTDVYGPHTNTIHPADITNTENRNIAGDVSATFTVRDISIEKAFTSSVVGRNGITTLTLTVINNYTVPLTNISFTDFLPGSVDDGIIIATPSNLSTTCTGTVSTGAQSITLTDGSLASRESCTITVDVQGTSTTAPPPGTTYTNRIEIGDVTGIINGSTATQNWHAASDDITVGSPDFRINKKFDPILVTGDTASTMTITLVNTESSPVSEIAFTDTLPTHMLLAVPPNPTTGTCGGTITPAADRMSFTFSGGSLAGNSQCQLTIRAMMEVTGNLINTIPAGSVTTREGMTNLDPTSATLTNLSSVGVKKHFSPNPVSPGGVSTLYLDVEKIGIGIGLTGLGLTDTLLYGLVIATPSNATNTCGGTLTADSGTTSIVLAGGAMPIGSNTCTIAVDVLVPSSGLRSGGYENCIPVGTVITDQGYTNVVEACDTLGNLFDPPTGYKVFDASGLPLLEWRMVWINDHNSANIDAQIRDTIPTGTTYVTGSLTCEERGLSVRSPTDPDACTYLVATNEVYWAGTIGPDRGATDEATADNEVVITFRVTVPDALNLVSNSSPSLTDTDGDGDFTDETTSASVATSNISTWYRFARSGRGAGTDIDAKVLPASGFAPGVSSPVPDMPAGIYETYDSLDMEIPVLGLKTNILGLYASRGKWDVSWLGSSLGYLEESAFPTWNGNSIITGHVFDSEGKPGPFNGLKDLKYGDRVIIHSYGQAYIYEVRDVLLVAPDDFKAAFKHEENSWLTLLTCQGYDSRTGNYASRLLVRAVLIEMQ